MDYTLVTLSLLGGLGILIHNLVKLNSLNREAKGEINIFRYWKIERFSIILSVCVVGVALIARTEVKQLESIGNWLGMAFVAIGYMAQSIVVSFSGKAQKYLNIKDESVKNLTTMDNQFILDTVTSKYLSYNPDNDNIEWVTGTNHAHAFTTQEALDNQLSLLNTPQAPNRYIGGGGVGTPK